MINVSVNKSSKSSTDNQVLSSLTVKSNDSSNNKKSNVPLSFVAILLKMMTNVTHNLFVQEAEVSTILHRHYTD